VEMNYIFSINIYQHNKFNQSVISTPQTKRQNIYEWLKFFWH
jgi:hypothetical protein